MKPIQVVFEERLLRELDEDEEVRRDGRSAVLRRAAAMYLRQKRDGRIAEAYRRAYGAEAGLGDEWDDWEDQGEWPPE